MSELEQQYRQAPKLKSPPRIDNTILQAAQAAANTAAVAPQVVSTADTNRSGARRKKAARWWQPGVAFASICAVGVGLGIALKSGMLQPSAPASIDYELADNSSAATQTAADTASEVALVIENDTFLLEQPVAELFEQTSEQMNTDADSQADELFVETPADEELTTELASDSSIELALIEQESQDYPSVASVEVAETSVAKNGLPESLPAAEVRSTVAGISATRSSVSADTIDATLEDSDALGNNRDESFSAQQAKVDVAESESVIVPLDDLQAQIADENTASAEQGIASTAASAERQKNSRLAKRSSALTVAPEPPAEVASGLTPAVVADPVIDSAAEEGVAVNLWLLQQDSDNYTVQIAQSETEAVLTALAKTIPLPTEVVGFEQDYTRWLLLHGSYPLQHLAEDALQTLRQVFSKNGVSVSDLNARVVRIGDIQLAP